MKTEIKENFLSYLIQMTPLGLGKSDKIERMIALTEITISGAY
jgi:hypothetical protein